MQKKKSISSASAEDLLKRIEKGEDGSDWERVRAMPQAEVEQLADAEEGAPAEDWEQSVELGLPTRKKAVHIRLDADVIDWFKSHGAGYQTRINAVLRSFVENRQRVEGRSPRQDTPSS